LKPGTNRSHVIAQSRYAAECPGAHDPSIISVIEGAFFPHPLMYPLIIDARLMPAAGDRSCRARGGKIVLREKNLRITALQSRILIL